MRIGIGIGIGFGSVLWTPAALPGLVAWYEAGPLWCFSDDAGTTPCNVGDQVAVWKPRSGAGQLAKTTASQRPTLQQVSGRYVVRGDGVDDNLNNASFTSSPKLWSVCVNRISNTGNTAGISNLITNADGALCIRTNSDTTYRGHNAGVAVNSGDVNDFDTGDTFWVDKVAAAGFSLGTAHVVTSQRGTPAAYTQLRILNDPISGARFYNGDVYGIVGTTATLTTADRGALETYLAALAGRSL